MVTRKRSAAKPKAASGQKSSGAKNTAAARKSAARLALVKNPPKSTASFADSLVKAGQPPGVGTVIYVHGIGNKPDASILKCQ